jgi:hypothetical protein
MAARVLLVVAMFLATVLQCRTMPYQVPLQGTPGGKRTLVLLDDMVRVLGGLLHPSVIQ